MSMHTQSFARVYPVFRAETQEMLEESRRLRAQAAVVREAHRRVVEDSRKLRLQLQDRHPAN